MSNVIPFDFNHNTVRVVDEEGQPWFFAQDLAEILGYSGTGAMNKLIDEEDRRIQTFLNGTTNMKQSLINESGVYSAIFGSTKPEAKPFKRWVTHEVLPAIRKTGSYTAPTVGEVIPLIQANRLFRSNLDIAQLIFKGNQAILSANMATRKATAIDVLDNMGATHLVAEEKDALLTASDIGRQIGLSGQKVNERLEQKGLVISFRDHKDRKRYELTEQGEQLGQTLDTARRHSDGSPVVQISWYRRILEVLKGEGAE
jgi:DNA-binding MarR family transcriptional regulator